MKKIISIAVIIILLIVGYQFYAKNKEAKKIETKTDVTQSDSMNGGNINEENWNVKPKDIEVKENNIIGETPNFDLENLDGKKISLESIKGKKVFINFWATWCPPCQGEMKEIQKVHENNKDIEVITIDVGESKEKVEKFMKEHGYTFEVLLDKDSDISSKYKARYLPTSILLNKDGKIENYRNGAMDSKTMEEFIK